MTPVATRYAIPPNTQHSNNSLVLHSQDWYNRNTSVKAYYESSFYVSCRTNRYFAYFRLFADRATSGR